MKAPPCPSCKFDNNDVDDQECGCCSFPLQNLLPPPPPPAAPTASFGGRSGVVGGGYMSTGPSLEADPNFLPSRHNYDQSAQQPQQDNHAQLQRVLPRLGDFSGFGSDVAPELQAFAQKNPHNMFAYEELELVPNGFFKVKSGQGDVSRAFLKTQSRRPVAVKFFKPETTTIAANLRECAIATRLFHPNLVQSIGIAPVPNWGVQKETRVALIMELCEGSLVDILKANAAEGLCWSRVIHYAQHIARGLEYLHVGISKQQNDEGARILMLDLKPANVLFKSKGEVLVLTDFGFSKRTAVERSATAVSMLGCTMAWSPPEQLKAVLSNDRNHRATPRHDVYSFGAVLFAMCTGREPHAGKGPLEMISLNLQDSITPDTVRPGCPGALVKLMCRCVDPVPERRPANGAELVTLLEQITESCPNLGPMKKILLPEDLSNAQQQQPSVHINGMMSVSVVPK